MDAMVTSVKTKVKPPTVAEHDCAVEARQGRIDRLQKQLDDTLIFISPVLFADVDKSALRIKWLDYMENFHYVFIQPDNRDVKRIIVSVQGGGVSMPALQWCKARGISVHLVNYDNTTNLLYQGKIQTSLKRRQYTLSREEQFEMTRVTVVAKLYASIETLGYLKKVRPEQSAMIDGMMEGIQNKLSWLEMNPIADSWHSIDRLRQAEGIAAKEYFRCLEGWSIPFVASELKRVPDTWKFYPGRFNGKKSSRHATDPLNTMLNYGYAIAVSLLREQVVMRGLDPYAGYYHVDKQGRESLLYDLVEWVRADIDRAVIEMIRVKKLHKGDYFMLPDGTLRVSHELGRHITLVVSQTLLHTHKDTFERAIGWYVEWLKRDSRNDMECSQDGEYLEEDF